MKKLLALLVLMPALGWAQTNEDSIFIKKISDDVFQNGRAYELLRDLAKNVGGRLGGSPEFAKAIQWGKKAMGRKVSPEKVK